MNDHITFSLHRSVGVGGGAAVRFERVRWRSGWEGGGGEMGDGGMGDGRRLSSAR